MPRTAKQVLSEQKQQAERDRTQQQLPASRRRRPGRLAGPPDHRSPRQVYLDTVAPSGIVGRLVKFDGKSGAFLFVDTEETFSDTEDFVVLADQTLAAYVKFQSEQAPTRIGGLLYAADFALPPRAQLGDTDPKKWEIGLSGRPEDPWREELMVVLKRPATMELLTFSTMSKTGRRAVGNLLKHYDRLQTTSPGSFPVVRLKPAGYQDSRYGWVHTLTSLSLGYPRGIPRLFQIPRSKRNSTTRYLSRAGLRAQYPPSPPGCEYREWPAMPHNTNAECAARLAAAGLFVFPVKAATRRPMFQGWRQRSSNDATVVAQWWQQYPNALPALDLAKCGLMALDGDRHGQGDGVAALRDLVRQQPGFDPRRVPTVRTPRDGVHLYFKQGSPPFGNHRGSLPAGVDAKGAGGFVLAPGAKLPDGRGYHGVAGQPELADAVLAGNLPELPPGIAGLIRPAPTDGPGAAGK